MKTCPTCNRSYTDASLNFCLEDGTPLVNSPAAGVDPNATIRYTAPRSTKPTPEPVYIPPPTPPPPQVPPNSYPGAPQWSPLLPPRKKSSAGWWIIGGLLVVGIIGVGAVIMIIAIASMNSHPNTNVNLGNVNSRNVNRNANLRTPNSNTNSDQPVSLDDDFSEQKWTTGSFTYGQMWYAEDEYHMRSKEGKYVVMYAPTDNYATGNATVKVTVRSVDGTSPTSGFGLVVHGERAKQKLEDYALLIILGDEPKYEIIKHKSGEQTAVIPWTSSSIIRSGTNPNQLEVRARGTDLTFYINGQYVDRIKDDENYREGIAGFYTSGVAEVTFDDLEIGR
ncbi:MAG TPA: hypothetical protein VLL54_02900 [Pyrinomonadaceae bacterium]|nr:hypothetical protein [Pyrinomonadaceae bacterium]